ncbi:hypothetical protein [Neptuniibacter sp. QD48_11]
MSTTKMTQKAASRIQRAEAKKFGGKVKPKSFPSRATRAVAKQGDK